MVSQKNVRTVKEVSGQLRQYPVIGLLDMFKLPASQLHQIRAKLKGKATIRMAKKRLIALALKDAGLKGADPLAGMLQGEPALIFTEMDPFKLARVIQQSKSEAPAKEGDIAPREIKVSAGPTPLPPGPVIGDLQKAKIPAMIEGDKIHVRQDTVVAREGDEIDGLLAGVLAKLGITPMEVGLNLVAAWEDGTVYGRDILLIPQERYLEDLASAHQRAFSLACSTGYPTKETMPVLLSRARQEAYGLAMAAGLLTSETVKPMLARAHAQMEALKARASLDAGQGSEEEPQEAATEEGAAEQPQEAGKPQDGAQAAPREEPAPEALEEAKPDSGEEAPGEGPGKDDAQPKEPEKKDS